MTYIDGFILAVPTANKDAYRQAAEQAAPLFKEFGATRQVEAWGDDVPEGKVTDFRRAVQATEDEDIVFSWIEYPDRATRDAANQRMMSDERMQDMSMPFDGKRMIFGGFDPIVDEGEGGALGYTDGFIVPVPPANREAYRALAAKASPVFREYGATRVVEAWGDDLKDGEVTDFAKAVKAEDGETTVFSFIEWPSKEARVAGWEKVMADPRMQYEKENTPFDGQRMFWGGFTPIFDK